ncbi:GAF domain-containing sensor histidine kinase [bacterium]|nr:GAF domain-containing sensor histidine kinase [bacterium]
MDEPRAVEPVAEIPSQSLIDCIYRIGQVMCRIEDVDHLLRSILRECCDLMGCETASIAVHDEGANDLRFSSVLNDDDQALTTWRIPMGVGIAGKVAQSQAPMLSNDPQHDAGWFGDIDRSHGFVTRNLIAVPMVYSGRLIGVLEALNRPADFQDADLRLLQIFGNQAAIAIQVQRLIKAKEENDRLAGFAIALADIGHSTKNILVRLKMPETLIDRAIEQRNWNMLGEPWGVMRRATDDIKRLVLEMLNYAKPRTAQMEPVDIAALARDVIDTCQGDASAKGIRLQLDCGLSDTQWDLDAEMMRPILFNLVGNAIEAIEGGGLSGGAVTVEVLADGHQRVINVRDNGPGIPEEIRGNLFKPFFTHGKRRGTGLGLANVRKGVAEQGGRVEVDSTPGEGATFSLIFPQSAG